jgi:hypothetical protein
MLYLSSLFYLVFSISLKPGTSYKQTSLDSVVAAWNRATYISLNKESTAATDSSQRQKYENRLEVLRDTYVDTRAERIDSGSLRYQILRKIFAESGEAKMDFYVIEANNSGAKILLRDFVVYPRTHHEFSTDVYIYGRDGWFKQAEVKNLNCDIVDGFEGNYAKFGHGFNEDDVIITKFEKNIVKYSEYFLSGTLAATSGIKEVLATYNTKNFIK